MKKYVIISNKPIEHSNLVILMILKYVCTVLKEGAAAFVGIIKFQLVIT